ncbi:MlaE family lipid ABC transporter permease subunit [Roseibacterium sp. SDUM158016]|uniref:ABC transporter permease n=1 Tax=Roseicyclus sediminis TaxID=2980997 RepID=UPI0021CE349A|nr:MlaE family lipid ABC transporter permease subunit [Roseibacterium sp. SDUM158016]MCU4653019.1 MlaE family lipid ABC transporter permease subunit [Roseibacterium sp. SDUM158016]
MNPDTDIGVEIDGEARPIRVTLSGAYTIHTLTEVGRRLDGLGPDIVIDLGRVTRLDTAGAWSLLSLRSRLEGGGGTLSLEGTTPEMDAVIETVAGALPGATETHDEDEGRTLADRLDDLGRAVVGGGQALMGYAGYLGLFLAGLVRVILHPREFRLTALVHHCGEVGLKAVPIVALMSFLIGIVLAFQGASQLRQFGAEVFVVDLIAVSILRELGILLTAIIVAGRTASAFTAAIGSMKMREEIDAMRTLGLDPTTVLFVPRILALLLMLPILGVIANFSGLVGGGLMSWIELGISPQMFQTRLLEGEHANHLMVGLVKAPFFALIIGVVGCRAGMQVRSNAESLGRQTSNSVVAAIFAVIVADALFSIFFSEIGV